MEWLSKFVLAMAIAAFLAAVGRFAWAGTSRGASLPEAVGVSIDSMEVESADHTRRTIDHPSFIVFANRSCVHCEGVGAMIRAALVDTAHDHLPVYVVYRDSIPEGAISSPSVQHLRLAAGLGVLGFVREVPTIVRTDRVGTVQAAFVGEGRKGVFRRMLYQFPIRDRR